MSSLADFWPEVVCAGAITLFLFRSRVKRVIDIVVRSNAVQVLPVAVGEERSPVAKAEKNTWREEWSAGYNLSGRQKAVLLFISAGLLGGLLLHTILTVQVVLALVALVFLSSSALRMLYIYRGIQNPPREDLPLFDSDLPSYTVVVALYREERIAKQLCGSLAELDYPKDRLQTLLVCEEEDKETIKALKQHLHLGQSVLVVPKGVPQTKPRALNFALQQARGDLITIYDAEDKPEPDQLRKAAAAFAAREEAVVALQARLDIYNDRQSLVSSLFSLEYLTLFSSAIPGIAYHNHAMPLGGTSTHFKTSVVRKIGGWDEWNVTEDCELGMRITASGLRSEALDSTTWEEAVSDWPSWIKQRSRWIKGYAQTFMAMLRRPLLAGRAMGWDKYAAALLTVGGVPLVLLGQVFTWGLMLYYLAGMIRNGRMTSLRAYFIEPLGSMTLIGLVAGLAMIIVMNAVIAHRQGRNRLVRLALLLPGYVMMASIAAWKGCLQLIYKPHFWEKTAHGGSLEENQGTLVESAYSPAAVPVETNEADNIERILQERRRIENKALESRTAVKQVEPGLVASMILAALACCLTLIPGYSSIENFSDSTSHLMTPARIWDNLSPGLDQLGLHWLPLYHLLQTPFAWYDPLLYSGLGAALVSSGATLLGVYYLYRLARHVGVSQQIAFLSCIGLLAAPSFWYASIIPLHYTLVVATGTASLFYLACWIKSERSRDLVLAGLWACAATLSHFDVWMLVFLETLVVGLVAWKQGGRDRLRGDVALWSILSFSGIALFVAMNVWWSGSPAQFLFGFHGSGNVVEEAHKGWGALLDYPRAVWTMAGPVLSVLGGLGAGMFAIRYHREPSKIVALLLLYPLLFFTVQAVTSGSIIEPHSDLGSWRNLRYAITIMPALCWFMIMGPSRQWVAALFCGLALIGAGVQVYQGEVAAWVDAKHDLDTGGQYGGSVPQVLGRANSWIDQNYRGGKIVMPIHSRLQDRLQWMTKLPSSSFVDSNDAALPGYQKMNSDQLALAGVAWIITMSENMDASAPTPRNGIKPGESACVKFDDRLGKTVVAVWAIGAKCPA